MEPVICIEGLSKEFSEGWNRSRRLALESLDLEILPGQLVGITGANGSGKSTLLKLFCGLVQVTGGHVRIAGTKPERAVNQNRVGYLPEKPEFPPYSTPGKLLYLYGNLSGLSGNRLDQRVQSCLTRCRLDAWTHLPVRTLSKGGLQRLAIAQALIHEPDILLWDEPMDGLDPLACEGLESLLKEMQAAGKTVVLATHRTDRLESLVDRVLILHEGRVLYWGSPDFDQGLHGWLLDRLKGEEVVGD